MHVCIKIHVCMVAEKEKNVCLHYSDSNQTMLLSLLRLKKDFYQQDLEYELMIELTSKSYLID